MKNNAIGNIFFIFLLKSRRTPLSLKCNYNKATVIICIRQANKCNFIVAHPPSIFLLEVDKIGSL